MPTNLSYLQFEESAVADRLRGHALDTPCIPSRTPSAQTGCKALQGFENLEFPATFKARRALLKLVQLKAGTPYLQGVSGR
jgi:threonine dehydratase